MDRLREVLAAIRASLGEEADDEALCHQLVAGRCGMDLLEYCDLLAGVARRRVELLSPRRATRVSKRASSRTAGSGATGEPSSSSSLVPAHRSERALLQEDALTALQLLQETLECLDAQGFDPDSAEAGRRDSARAHRRELKVLRRSLSS